MATENQEIKITRYTSRTGETFERYSNNQGNSAVIGETQIQAGRMGYFSRDTIVKVASGFAARNSKKPALDDIASDLFISPQMGDVEGGIVVYYDAEAGKYKRSHTIVKVETRKE
ncbi:hypothetical protein FJZ19_05765 [Candidatus Pacearchaeota archaeon]|nr:hypothetical protein [Candidatus Pacearchaeota archaeon]